MKKLFILPLAISSLAFANNYTLSFTGSRITDKPFGMQKEFNNKPIKHSGSIAELSLSEDKGQKFFGVNIRTGLHIGLINSNIKNTFLQTIAGGVDKQLYHNFGKLQTVGFLGVGYKLTSQNPKHAKYDNTLPSQFYFRLGAELNYFLTHKVSIGLQYKHFSNGGLTTANYGYDFYGVKINLMI